MCASVSLLICVLVDTFLGCPLTAHRFEMKTLRANLDRSSVSCPILIGVCHIPLALRVIF